MHGLSKAAVAILGACLSVSMVDAASIGIKITAADMMDNTGTVVTTGNPAATMALPTDMLGLPTIAQAHWNNIAGKMDYDGTYSDTTAWASGSYQGGLGYAPKDWPVNEWTINHTLGNLTDSTGATLAGTSVTWNIGANWRNHKAPGWWLANANLQKLYNGMIQNSSTITVTGVPYAQYDIYAYYWGNDNPGTGTGTATLSLPTGVTGTLSGPQTYNWSWASWPASDTMLQGLNYVVLSGNTASGFVLNTTTTNGTGIAAFQIVNTAVPEPTSIGLIVLGAGALLHRRRAGR